MINQKRTESFRKKTANELTKIAASGSLGAAAAQYERNRRTK